MDIKGVGAIVTGGASGLGAATVRRLVAEGARCTIADRDEALGNALSDELGDAARFVATDVTDSDSMAAAVAAVEGSLRIAVNCAGIPVVGPIVDADGQPGDLDAFRRVVEVNTVGAFNSMRFEAAAMRATAPVNDGERGLIVNVASVAAFDAQANQVAYAASKGAIVAITLPAARELSAIGVRVLAIAPGRLTTPMIGSPEPTGNPVRLRDIPFPKRLGYPHEFGDLVEHLCTNRYLNGELIRLDAGLRMPFG